MSEIDNEVTIETNDGEINIEYNPQNRTMSFSCPNGGTFSKDDGFLQENNMYNFELKIKKRKTYCKFVEKVEKTVKDLAERSNGFLPDGYQVLRYTDINGYNTIPAYLKHLEISNKEVKDEDKLVTIRYVIDINDLFNI